MKKALVFAFLFSCVQLLAQTETYFLSNPTLTPDGQTVIFAFEGDLWKAAVADGKAARLTAMQGAETKVAVPAVRLSLKVHQNRFLRWLKVTRASI